jgi:hypothetical protein
MECGMRNAELNGVGKWGCLECGSGNAECLEFGIRNVECGIKRSGEVGMRNVIFWLTAEIVKGILYL